MKIRMTKKANVSLWRRRNSHNSLSICYGENSSAEEEAWSCLCSHLKSENGWASQLAQAEEKLHLALSLENINLRKKNSREDIISRRSLSHFSDLSQLISVMHLSTSQKGSALYPWKPQLSNSLERSWEGKCLKESHPLREEIEELRKKKPEKKTHLS